MTAKTTTAPLGLAVALALLASLGYGSLGLLVRAATRAGVETAPMLAWRFTLAALLLAPVVAKDLARVPRRRAGAAVALGAVGFATQAFCYVSAIERIGATMAASLLYLYPGLVLVLVSATGGPRPRRLDLAVLAVGTAGCVLAVYAPGAVQSQSGEGYGFALLTALVYALYLVIGHGLTRALAPATTTFFVCCGAAASFWVVGTVSGALSVPRTVEAWSALGGMALFCTVVPMGALFAAMRILGPARTAFLSMTEPVWAALIGIAVLQERPNATQLVGGLLIVGAAFALQMGLRRSAPP